MLLRFIHIVGSYPQYSVFRRGLNLMRKAFKGKVLDSIYILWSKIESQFFRLLGISIR
jgi:hypothetical protein